MLWRKAERRAMNTSRRKHPPPTRGRKEQVVRVLHRKEGGAIDEAINLVLLHREEE